MGKIVLTSNITLDGVVQDPDGAEGFAQAQVEGDGEILIYASYQLARTLIEHSLRDDLRPVVFPVVVGSGHRLFEDDRTNPADRGGQAGLGTGATVTACGS